MTDNDIIPFGKFKGTKLANIPADYFVWLNEQDWCTKAYKDYIEDNKDVLNQELKDKGDTRRI